MLISGDFGKAIDLLSKASTGSTHLSYSQFGEDRLIEVFFHDRTTPGFYVDVGAHHPERFSNTFLLHMKGWRGINIDGDKKNIEYFESARPQDINIAAFISDDERTATFNKFSDTAVNTISDRAAEHYQNFWTLLEKTEVRTQTLANLLNQHLGTDQEIDLLNVDVEGVDLEVLRGNDWTRHRPRLVLVEAEGLNLSDIHGNAIVDFMLSRNYKLAAFMHVTAFFTCL